ncbi:hypothetical protein V6N13_062997 [Hibiscus sabdariffa]|uniref:Uncharacterized protein n=2 Tax=Hibiscus sabdariffa TaxID=183260 RepID=A0ABR2A3M4_9ROSI
MKLGIAPCDQHGLPILTPPSKESPIDGESEPSDYDDDGGSAGDTSETKERHHGPNKPLGGSSYSPKLLKSMRLYLLSSPLRQFLYQSSCGEPHEDWSKLNSDAPQFLIWWGEGQVQEMSSEATLENGLLVHIDTSECYKR